MFALYFLLIAQSAHAYIDPGTGTAILQILFGIGLGIIIVGRRSLVLVKRKISSINIFKKKQDKKNCNNNVIEGPEADKDKEVAQ